MKIYFNRNSIIVYSIMIIGIVMFISGIVEQQKYKSPIPIEAIDADYIQVGDYISGNITSFLINNNNSVFNPGVSAQLDSVTNSLMIYNVPVKNNKYMRIVVSDINTQLALKTDALDPHISIPFEGIVISSSYPINENWYQQVEGVDVSQIIPGILIEQISSDKGIYRSYMGVVTVISCLIILCSGVTAPLMTTEETESYLKPNKYGQSCDTEYELECEHRKQKHLEQRLEQIQREHVTGLFLLFLGAIGFIFAAILSSGIPNVFPKLQLLFFAFPSIVILVLAASYIFNYYIHSYTSFGTFLRRIKSITPIPLQIEKCKLNIQALEERLAKENENNSPIYSDKTYADYLELEKNSVISDNVIDN